MNSEYIITKEQVRMINEKCGGGLRNDAEIETALDLGKGKAVYRKIAYMWRAILVGHPFTDGNKRTSLVVSIAILKKCKVHAGKTEKENMVDAIRKIASENITDINRIERLVRYAVSGN